MIVIDKVFKGMFLEGYILATLVPIAWAILLLFIWKDFAREPDRDHFSKRKVESRMILYSFILYGVTIFIAVVSVFQSLGYKVRDYELSSFFVGIFLYMIPALLISKKLRQWFEPSVLGVICNQCARFIHFDAWICGFCQKTNYNWFVDKCSYCRRKASHIFCPACNQEALVNERVPSNCARFVPPPPIPYKQQEAELAQQMENLEREAKIAEMRIRVKEKAAEVRRVNESIDLDRVEQMRREVEAQVEHELSKNLEQKLVFSRMREKIKETYGKDTALQGDALTVLDSLEERAKTEAMRRPQRV